MTTATLTNKHGDTAIFNGNTATLTADCIGYTCENVSAFKFNIRKDKNGLDSNNGYFQINGKTISFSFSDSQRQAIDYYNANREKAKSTSGKTKAKSIKVVREYKDYTDFCENNDTAKKLLTLKNTSKSDFLKPYELRIAQAQETLLNAQLTLAKAEEEWDSVQAYTAEDFTAKLTELYATAQAEAEKQKRINALRAELAELLNG